MNTDTAQVQIELVIQDVSANPANLQKASSELEKFGREMASKLNNAINQVDWSSTTGTMGRDLVQLQDRISSLAADIGSLGTSTSGAGQAMSEDMKQIEAEADNTVLAMRNIEEELKAVYNLSITAAQSIAGTSLTTDHIDNLVLSYLDLENALSALISESATLNSNTVDPFAEFQQKANELLEVLNQVPAAMEQLSTATSTNKTESEQATAELNRQTEALEQLQQRAYEYASNSKTTDMSWSVLTTSAHSYYEQIAEIGPALGMTEDELEKFKKIVQEIDRLSPFRTMEDDLDDCLEVFGQLTDEMAEMKENGENQGEAWESSLESARSLLDAISGLNDALGGVVDLGPLQSILDNLQSIGQASTSASTEVGGLAGAFGGLVPAISKVAGVIGIVVTVVHTVISAIQKFNQALLKTFATIGKIVVAVKKYLDKVAQFFREITSRVLEFVKNAYTKLSSLFNKLLDKLRNLLHLNKSFGSSGGSMIDSLSKRFKKLLKSVMQFGLGFRSVYFMIKKMRTVFISMFKAMAEQIPEINVQVSSLLTAINQLKGSIVTAFQPIISFVIPTFVKFINVLSETCNWLGEFFAALTGQGYIYKFVATPVDYAKEQLESSSETKAIEAAKKKVQDAKDAIAKFYDDEADAEEEANEKAKEYQKTLLGFDEINKLNAPEEDDEADAKALKDRTDQLQKLLDALADAEAELADLEDYDPTKAAGGVWEKVPLTNKVALEWAKRVKEFWAEIKEAWENGADFTKIGKKVSKALVKVLDKATDFIEKEVRERLLKLAKASATFLNGALTQELARAISNFALALVNTIQSTVNRFFTKFDWHNLGKFLATSFNTAIQKWDAKGFGQMIANFIVAAVKTWWTFVNPNEGFNFEQLGHKLATALNSTVAKLSKIDPQTSINMWQELGQAISNSIIGAINSAVTFINESDFTGLVNGVTQAIQSIDWKGMANAFDRLKEAVKQALIKIWDNISWQKIIDKGKKKINETIDKILTGVITLKNFSQKIQKLLQGLRKAIESADMKEISQGIASAIAELFNSLDLGSITGELIELGVSLINLLITALVTTITKSNFGNIARSLSEKLSNIDWKQVGINLTHLAKAILAALTEFIKGLDWEELGKDISDLVSNIDWEGIAFELGGLISALVSGLQKAEKNFNWALEFEKIGLNIIKGLIKGVEGEGGKGQLFSVVKWIFDQFMMLKILFGIFSPSKVMFGIGENIAQGLINGVKSIINNIKQVWENLKENVITKWDEIKTSLSTKMTELKTKIGEIWDKIKTMIGEKIEGTKEKIKTAVEDIKTSWTTTWESIKTKTDEIWGGIKEVVKGSINWIIDCLNAWLRSGADKLNHFIELANSVSIGDKHLNIPTITAPQIPRLAKGAVIPPNKEFLAMLGDQKSGTNIEAPLSTIQDAVASVISEQMENAAYQAFVRALKDSGNTYTFVAQLNGKTLFEEVVKQNKSSVKSFGISPLSAY